MLIQNMKYFITGLKCRPEKMSLLRIGIGSLVLFIPVERTDLS